MDRFKFITDDTFRRMIERDKLELDKCFNEKLSKSVLILTGSIIEAILVDYFLAFLPSDRTKEQLLRATLEDLINLAERENLISARIKDLSTVVRGYRNLIHPGKEYRLNEYFDIRSATVAVNLLDMIIDEISKNYADKLGYTMEQAIEKIKIDPNCIPIIPHIVEKMVVSERIKLFCHLPDECRSIELESMIESFLTLHAKLSGSIPESVVLKETIKVYEYMQTKSKEDLLYYLRFHSMHLDKLSDEQLDAIIVYILGILENPTLEDIKIFKYRELKMLGIYFNKPGYIEKFFDCIEFTMHRVSGDIENSLLDVLEGIFTFIDINKRNDIVSRLKEKTYSAKAQRWATKIDDFLPF